MAPTPQPGAAPGAIEESQSGIAEKTASGVLWLTIQKWAIRLVGFITIAVLTRLLSPEDFGTVAAASTVLPFFYLLADLGFATYIVQVAKTDQRMLSTAFWFSLVAGMLLCSLVVAIAPIFGLVFGNDAVVPVLRMLSLWVVVTALGSVPMALLRREMRFSALAVQGAVAAAVSQAVALVLALGGYGVWALVGQALAGQIVGITLAWFSVRWLPSLIFSRHSLGVMSRFGGQVLGVEFVAMLRVWGEAAVISSVLGVAALGHMTIAQRLVQTVQDLAGSAIVPVSHVAFAKVREDTERMRHAYLRSLRMTNAVLSPPLIVVAVSAPLLMPIVFGHGWDASYPVAQILALAGLLSIGAWLDHGLFYGAGKPGSWLAYAITIDSLTFLTTLVTARWGLVAIATGFLGVALIATVSRWFLVARLLKTNPRRVAGPFAYLALVAVGAGGAGWGAMEVTTGLEDWVSVLVIGVVVMVVHLTITLLIARGTVADFLRIVGGTRLGAWIPSGVVSWAGTT